jgi:hypothetical protein
MDLLGELLFGTYGGHHDRRQIGEVEQVAQLHPVQRPGIARHQVDVEAQRLEVPPGQQAVDREP